jgi:hypothetical protein
MSDQNGLQIACLLDEADQATPNAFIPFQLTSQIDEAFPLGEVLISAATVDEVHPAFVQGCLRRHADEDWGEVNRLIRWGNSLTLRGEHFMPIVSKYRIGDRALQIVTKADGSVTSIVLFAADHPASLPDTELPVLFDGYEIHGVVEFSRVPDDEAESWGLFGHVPGQGLICIGDFSTRKRAEEVYARITGQRYGSRP